MGNLKLKDKTRKKEKKMSATLLVNEEGKENEKVKPTEKKKRKRDNKVLNMDTEKEVTGEQEENEKIKPIGKMKKKRDKGNNDSTKEVVQVVEEEHVTVEGKKMKSKASNKKIKHEMKKNPLVGKSDKGTKQHGEPKKSKKRKMERGVCQESKSILEKKVNGLDNVYCISSGEEDCSKGMKKWLAEYHQSRPVLKVLQQRIDDFINAHEEKLEQERKEREAEAARDGWTVVVHHKGRKKTTDSESGITVGSVAPAVAEKLGTVKKHKEVNLEFYRFQKRESQRNEILALQSKFEQDKKRIQQLRAARKFKPYWQLLCILKLQY